jgi:hypothetical protein
MAARPDLLRRTGGNRSRGNLQLGLVLAVDVSHVDTADPMESLRQDGRDAESPCQYLGESRVGRAAGIGLGPAVAGSAALAARSIFARRVAQ